MNRVERTNSELKKQLSSVLQDGIKDPRVQGLITIMKVDCDPDLTLAKVYVSVLGANGKEKEVIEGLSSAEGYIKSCLKGKIKLRSLPQLRFILDENLDYSYKISKILHEINAKGSDDDDNA